MEDAQIYGHSICDNNGEEDYIELEVISSSNSTISLFHFKKISPPPPQHEEARSSEFEFKMLPNFIDRNITTSISTADELFYNGKLLPLDHIPLHNNPISNKFLHVGKKIVDFEQSFSTPFLQSCNLSQENYLFEYSTNDESSKKSTFLHVAQKNDFFEQSFSTPFCQSCHVSRKLNQEDYSTYDESSKSSKLFHVSKSFDDFDQSLNTPFCQSCHVSRKLNQQDYSTNDESSKSSKLFQSFDDFDQSLNTPFCQSCHISRKLNQEDLSKNDESSTSSKLFHVSKSFDDFDQSLDTPFCQSCHVSKKLNNQEECYYSTDDDESSSKTSKFLHVSKSFDDFKQSFSTPLFQSCHVSGELINNQEDYFFGYSTDSESSRKSKWTKGSLTRKLRLIKQLSFDHSKIKCLINNSVKLVAKKDIFGKIHHKKSSFSGAIKKLLTTKSCSSKNSTHGNIQEMHLLVRNKDHVYTEVDPIQAAIAHCKNSHQLKKFNSRKSTNVSDTIGLGRSLSTSKIIFEEQERIGLCRG